FQPLVKDLSAVQVWVDAGCSGLHGSPSVLHHCRPGRRHCIACSDASASASAGSGASARRCPGSGPTPRSQTIASNLSTVVTNVFAVFLDVLAVLLNVLEIVLNVFLV